MLVSLVAVLTTALALHATGRRPTRQRAVLSIVGAVLVFFFQSTLMLCRCARANPIAEWALMAACLAITLAGVGHPWLRRSLAVALVVASFALVH